MVDSDSSNGKQDWRLKSTLFFCTPYVCNKKKTTKNNNLIERHHNAIEGIQIAAERSLFKDRSEYHMLWSVF
jgi:hypothetical protein